MMPLLSQRIAELPESIRMIFRDWLTSGRMSRTFELVKGNEQRTVEGFIYARARDGRPIKSLIASGTGPNGINRLFCVKHCIVAALVDGWQVIDKRPSGEKERLEELTRERLQLQSANAGLTRRVELLESQLRVASRGRGAVVPAGDKGSIFLPKSRDEIEKTRRSAPRCGVYFLFFEDELQYVGQSVNILARIGTHAQNGVAFDSWSFVPIAKEKLMEIERNYIMAFDPPLNKILKPKWGS